MELVDLVNAHTRRHSAQFVGKTVEVLCEDYDPKRNLYFGRSEHGRMVYFENDSNAIGTFKKVTVEEANGISLMGKLI